MERCVYLIKITIRITIFSLKTGVVAGTIYYTVDQGVWKKSDETAHLYGRIYTTIAPWIKDVKKDIPIEIPELPSAEQMLSSVQNGWNKGVIVSSVFLLELPSKISGWSQCGASMVMKQIRQAQGDLSQDAKPTIENKQ